MASRQPDLDRASMPRVDTDKTGREGGGVVGDHHVAGVDEVQKAGPRVVRNGAVLVHDQQPCVGRALNRRCGGNHASTPAAEMTSRAAASGRFSVAGSASGTASA